MRSYREACKLRVLVRASSSQWRTAQCPQRQYEMGNCLPLRDSCWPAAPSAHWSSSSFSSSKGPRAPVTAPGTSLSARSAWAPSGVNASHQLHGAGCSCSALPSGSDKCSPTATAPLGDPSCWAHLGSAPSAPDCPGLILFQVTHRERQSPQLFTGSRTYS